MKSLQPLSMLELLQKPLMAEISSGKYKCLSGLLQKHLWSYLQTSGVIPTPGSHCFCFTVTNYSDLKGVSIPYSSLNYLYPHMSKHSF